MAWHAAKFHSYQDQSSEENVNVHDSHDQLFVMDLIYPLQTQYLWQAGRAINHMNQPTYIHQEEHY